MIHRIIFVLLGCFILAYLYLNLISVYIPFAKHGFIIVATILALTILLLISDLI